MDRVRVAVGVVAIIVAAIAVAGYLIASEPLRADLARQERSIAALMERTGFVDDVTRVAERYFTNRATRDEYEAALALGGARIKEADLRERIAVLGWRALAVGSGTLLLGTLAVALLPGKRPARS